MSILYCFSKKITFFLIGFIILSFLGSCGIWDPADARKIPSNSKERVKKNLEEGRGFSLKGMVSGGKEEQTIHLQALIQCGEQH